MNFLTVSQAADRLGVCRQMVHYLIKTKQINATWMLNRWAIPSDEVARYKRKRNGRLRAATATV